MLVTDVTQVALIKAVLRELNSLKNKTADT